MSEFPIIRTIEDVLPHIHGREDVGVVDKGEYKFIKYVSAFMNADLFDSEMRRECRGLKFAPDGRIIARPYHKFFNYGERATGIDVLKPHHILDKLDGSLVHGCLLPGNRIRLMTLRGITDTSIQAEKYLTENEGRLMYDMLYAGYTPIFEFVAPENQIVIRYETPRLVLTGIRANVTGEYMTRAQLESFAQAYSVELVATLGTITQLDDFIEQAKARRGIEGYVIRYENGHMVKVKTEEYILFHKAKDEIWREKNAFAVVLSDGVDDILPLLSPDDASALERFAHELNTVLSLQAKEIERAAEESRAKGEDRLDFARRYISTIDKALAKVAFRALDGKDAFDELRMRLLRMCGSGIKVERNRHLFGGLRWKDYMPSSLPADNTLTTE